MPRYIYTCPNCNTTKEIIESISARSERKYISCSECKHHMLQDFSGSNAIVSKQTIGGAVDKNTDRMSLDSKIYYGTKELRKVNHSIKQDDETRKNQSDMIERTIRKITREHNK